jgi:hypothetical protein
LALTVLTVAKHADVSCCDHVVDLLFLAAVTLRSDGFLSLAVRAQHCTDEVAHELEILVKIFGEQFWRENVERTQMTMAVHDDNFL